MTRGTGDGPLAAAALIDAGSVPDAGAFLVRVLRLDADALVRLRPADRGEPALWAALPFGVLVARPVRGAAAIDATVRADALLAELERLPSEMRDGQVTAGDGLRVLPSRHDAAWRLPLPPDAGRIVEELPADELLRVSAAAAATVRTAAIQGVAGRAVGSRALRDALLDHVPIVVTTEDGARVEVPQRLVQGLTRMGFAAPGGPVLVRIGAGWTGLVGVFGSAWYRPSGGPLSLRPVR